MVTKLVNERFKVRKKERFKVRKKDGEIVGLVPRKIYQSLKEAAAYSGVSSVEVKAIYSKILHNLNSIFLPGETILSSKLETIIIDVLQKNGYSPVARIYYSRSHLKQNVKRKIKVLKRADSSDVDVTDGTLLVTNTRNVVTSPWDRKMIEEALIRETGLNKNEAKNIAKEVERKIVASNLKDISTSLIRELIDNSLFTKGYNSLISKQTEVGISTYDLEKIVLSNPNENSNISSHNPEAVNLATAEVVLKQYALNRVFSQRTSLAHKEGLIHIHDLGYPIRVYCSAHSLEYIKKYGLKMDNLDIISSPAKHARTLTGHLNTFLASMQAYYAGALGIGYVNIFYAPYLKGMSYKEIKQEAQYLIFSLSQSAFSRGGQVLFVDANVHTGIPKYFRDVPAIGPGGKYTGHTYKDYEKEAQEFLRALLEVWGEGDSRGTPFAFPKCDLHINEDTYTDPAQRDLLLLACDVAARNGSPYFVFDRDEVTLSACCRLRTKIEDVSIIKKPESMRFCGFQNVSINLPQTAYRAARKGKKNLEGVMEEIERAMDLAVKAHIEKKEFIKKMMKPGKPLWMLGKVALDGRLYVDLDKATYIIGMVGLNECLDFITGSQLHESDEVYEAGLKLISFMYLKVKEYEKAYSMKFSLEESPAESAVRRLSKIDLKLFPESKEFVRGSIEKDETYYTNSIHFLPNAPIDFLERVEKQSRFHPLIESGAIVHAFVGEAAPSAASIYSLIQKCWEKTQCAQMTISPEFTICKECENRMRGLKDSCPYCGSLDVYGLTRIVGYYSRVTNWNKSKQGELKDRHAGNYSWGA